MVVGLGSLPPVTGNPWRKMKLDAIGRWTEVKLSILEEYSRAYATILAKQKIISHFAYIDGFAGAGHHISKSSGALVEGSPTRALRCGFSHCHLIDLDGDKTQLLRQIADGRDDVTVYTGDCSEVLLREVFPQCRFEDYRRALCLLDPYDLNPRWEVVQAAGSMRSVEMFINFMIMDANMNVLLRAGPTAASQEQIDRMNTFWGDESWKEAAYKKGQGLFGEMTEKGVNAEVAAAYRKRLQDVAGFKYVPEPLAMLSGTGAVIYYLFFASQNAAGDQIARSIFDKYRKLGESCG